jgi:MFS family permease
MHFASAAARRAGRFGAGCWWLQPPELAIGFPGVNGTSPATETSPRYQGWRVVAASGVGVFFSTLAFFTFGVFLKPLSQEFGWSRETVTTAYGALALAAAVSAPFIGRLVDIVGPMRVIVPSALLSGIAFASLAALTPRPLHLQAVFALLGMGAVGSSALVHTRVAVGWFESRRGLALGLLMAAASIGGVVHPPAAEALVRTAGWRAAYLTMGGLLLAVGLPTVLLFVRERKAVRVEGDSPSVALREGLRSRVFWTLVVVVFGGTLAWNSVMAHLAALLGDRGVTANEAAAAVSVMAGASLAGRIVTGWLLDRYLATRVAFVLLVIAAIGAFLLAGAESLAAGTAGAALLGFGAGGESDVAPYLLSRYFGLRSLGALYGFIWTAVGAAGVIGPVLVARDFDATGSYQRAFLMLAAATAAAALPALTLPDYRREPVRRS